MKPGRFYLELPIRPGAPIEPLRDAVIGVIRAAFSNLRIRDPLLVAAGELVENAARWGLWEGENAAFAITVHGAEDHFQVSASNPIRPDDPHVARLEETLLAIERAPSTQEAYLSRMRHAALERPQVGLGLSRISHECGCRLSLERTADGRQLTVRAVAHRSVRPTPAPPP